MSVIKMNINNRDFEVECGFGQEDTLVELSYELDRRIKENAQIFGDTNTNLLFVITSLQLLDELHDIRNGGQQGIDLESEIGRATASTLSQITGRIEELAERITRKAS